MLEVAFQPVSEDIKLRARAKLNKDLNSIPDKLGGVSDKVREKMKCDMLGIRATKKGLVITAEGTLVAPSSGRSASCAVVGARSVRSSCLRLSRG
jgi:hypothetical protein